MSTQHGDHILAIVFDLGRVLVRVDLRGGLFRYYVRDHPVSDQEIINKIFNDEIFVAFTTGKIEPLQLYRLLQAQYQLQLPFEEFVREWCSIITPMEGMAELVVELSQRYVLGILSDTDPLHWQYCRQQFSFLQLFPKPTLSYQTGLLKPDPRCYQLAAKNIDMAVYSCLFIDDREENVSGALKAGMPAMLFTGVESLRQELKNLHLL
jgi:HAD superfamily hydrolase (TIGR01509 family)